MSQQALEEKILSLVSLITKNFQPEKIILFGSLARGQWTRESDIDICVIQQENGLSFKRKVWDLLWKNNYDWSLEPDIHAYHPTTYQNLLERNDPFIKEIAKGRVLYEKQI